MPKKHRDHLVSHLSTPNCKQELRSRERRVPRCSDFHYNPSKGKRKSVPKPKLTNQNIHGQSYSRQCHVVAWVQPHLDDSGPLDVHLLAGRGVPARDPAGLVEPVRLHTPGVIAHEHLQHHGLVVAFQLQHARWAINTGTTALIIIIILFLNQPESCLPSDRVIPTVTLASLTTSCSHPNCDYSPLSSSLPRILLSPPASTSTSQPRRRTFPAAHSKGEEVLLVNMCTATGIPGPHLHARCILKSL